MKIREVLRRIHKDGWYIVRQRGSHRQFHHPNKPGTVTVAGKENEDVHPKTLATIWQQAGLDHEGN